MGQIIKFPRETPWDVALSGGYADGERKRGDALVVRGRNVREFEKLGAPVRRVIECIQRRR